MVTQGNQLVPPFTGSPSSALNLATNVSPNALLGSGSYPLPSAAGPGPLTAPPLGAGETFWDLSAGSNSDLALRGEWSSLTAVYAVSNSPSNLGGIVPVGGLTIDGYVYAAGTYVFQFMDLSASYVYLEPGYASVLFRGCRMRVETGAPGAVHPDPAYTGFTGVHYGDIGWQSAADVAANPSASPVGLDFSGVPHGARVLRCYVSYVSTGIQPNNNSGVLDVIENYVEKITNTAGAHLNGITLNGGNANALILRNHVVLVTPDENGTAVDQTDCISLFQDFGDFAGNGTNSDGSTGYFISGNYVGGTGYCFYIGQNSGTMPDTVNNLIFTNNLVTTSQYSTGGVFGPAAAIPTWGSFGNFESGNLWADGPLARTQDIFGNAVTTVVNTFAGGTNGTGVTTGNSGGASGNAFDSILNAFGGTTAYDSAHAIASTLSADVTLPSAANAGVQWGTSLTSGTPIGEAWFRIYVYLAANLAHRETIVQFNPSSGFGPVLDLGTSGLVQFLDANGTTQLTSANSISTGAWARIEGYVIASATVGQFEFKLFLSPNSVTPDETQTSGATQNTGIDIASVGYGFPNGQAAEQMWMDGLGASSSGYIGPVPAAAGGGALLAGWPP
jgi:hypothetical protein